MANEKGMRERSYSPNLMPFLLWVVKRLVNEETGGGKPLGEREGR